jgi:hypothetical protein
MSYPCFGAPSDTLDLSGLEPDAQEVVHRIVKRAEAGRRQYGDLQLDRDRRDWIDQGIEEVLDLSFYLAAALVKIQRAASAARGEGGNGGGR